MGQHCSCLYVHRLGTHQCMCIQHTVLPCCSQILLTHSRDLQNCDIHCVGVCRFSPRAGNTHVGMLAQATNTLMQIAAYQYIWVLQQPQSRLHMFCVLRRNICARICAGSLDMLMSTRSVHVYIYLPVRFHTASEAHQATYYIHASATGLGMKRWKTTATYTESWAQFLLTHHICCVVWQLAQ